MKVIDNTDTSVEFYTIKVGECFIFDNCLFIRIKPVKEYERDANAFCFVDNNITYVHDACVVTPVNAEVVIRSKGVE